MRLILLTSLLFLFSSTALSLVIEGAYEAGEIRIEYYDTSKSGKIFVKECNHCNQSIYDFQKIPTININQNPIPLDEYLQLPEKPNFGTIVIDVMTKTVIRINF